MDRGSSCPGRYLEAAQGSSGLPFGGKALDEGVVEPAFGGVTLNDLSFSVRRVPPDAWLSRVAWVDVWSR